MIIVVLRSMWLIRLFDPLFGTTRGGVNTELLDWITYRTSFVMFDIGYGSAMAIVSWAVHHGALHGDVPAADEADGAQDLATGRRPPC